MLSKNDEYSLVSNESCDFWLGNPFPFYYRDASFAFPFLLDKMKAFFSNISQDTNKNIS